MTQTMYANVNKLIIKNKIKYTIVKCKKKKKKKKCELDMVSKTIIDFFIVGSTVLCFVSLVQNRSIYMIEVSTALDNTADLSVDS
jgi:hypothetical protein